MKFANKRIAVIFNPKGGSAKGGLIDQLKAELLALGVTLVQYTTTPAPGSARELATRAAADGADLVVACGGDGTVCQVAEGLMETGVPMAVLPGGTGNLFARAFNAPPDVPQFVQRIVAGQPQPLDMTLLTYRDLEGRQHEQLYLVAMGLGNISDAISFASPEMKRRFGKLVYVVRVLKACFSPGPVKYKLSADNGAYVVDTEASAMFALNAVPPSMATLSRGCNASDGLVDLVAVRATGFFGLLRFSLRMASGRPDLSPHYLRMRARSVRIETNRPVCPNIDGDPGHKTQSMEICTLPQAVKVIVS
ncbi:MAG: diacylglycerol kinase family lipid kinase [Cyanobacteria bacterium SZAS LIN-3]|nr:diacylglycerol kinase family lipid kinase [Cyanobacteria bacterium SZAS LIN-3]